MVWIDRRDGNNEVYYKNSLNEGSSWSNDIRLTNDNTQSYSPSISSFGNTIGVVWTDDRHEILNFELYFKRSLNNGLNWDPEVRLTNSLQYSQFATITILNFNINVVWQDERNNNSEIYFKESTDLGTNWFPDLRLTYANTATFSPSIAVQDTTVHVVWPDSRNGNYEIYYKRRIHVEPPVQMPSLLTPPNNSVDVSLTPFLEWDTVANSESFQIQLSTENNFNSLTLDSNVSVTNIHTPIGILVSNMQYFLESTSK